MEEKTKNGHCRNIMWLDLSGYEHEPKAGSFGHVNKPVGSITHGRFPDQLNDYKLI
jgi:hypothetical protein